MANPSWPSTLPKPQLGSANYVPMFDPVLRTSMEAGAPKTRLRVTAVPETFTGQLMLTSAQLATLRTFYATTLKYVGAFDWVDFRSGAAKTYVFSKPPAQSKVANHADLWQVSLELMTVL